MSVIDSSPAKRVLGASWLVFASVNCWLMYLLPGEETIPYHLIWASYALLYGLFRWSLWTTWLTFAAITVLTGIALIAHAQQRIIGWEECSEIVLMGVLVALLIWHVRREQHAKARLSVLRETERQRAEQREIAARFGSHEVRTRLTIARGFAELIKDNATDETNRADAAVVLRELDKASLLATQLLTLVRVETPSEQVPLHLGELLAAILARWQPTADRAWGAEVSVGLILGDPERLESAMDCLIENAVKFTVVGDSIRLGARMAGNVLVLWVSDSGAGMPDADRRRVIEVFQTGSAAGERAGSGLGLAIVKAIVDARDGSLQIDSAPGQGTTVTIKVRAGWPFPASSPTPGAQSSGESGVLDRPAQSRELPVELPTG